MILGHLDQLHPYLDEIFAEHVLVTDEKQLDEVDALIFWGGTDVSPRLYDQEAEFGSPKEPTKRDIFEVKIYDLAKKKKLPCIGICRGAQLLNVINGGSLFQHIDTHMSDHYVKIPESFEKIFVTSDHHQGIALPRDAIELAYDTIATPTKAWMSKNKYTVKYGITEIAAFPQHKTVICQGHPEYTRADPRYHEYFLQQVLKWCFN